MSTVRPVAFAACLLAPDVMLALGLIALLWLQEGVLKTFQGRLGERLLVVEAALKSGNGVAMQLHSDWLATRPGGAGLLLQYVKSALRPTVALPYPLLMGLAAIV